MCQQQAQIEHDLQHGTMGLMRMMVWYNLQSESTKSQCHSSHSFMHWAFS